METRITALYVCVSTEEQAKEGYSIAAQIDRLKAYAKFQGWTSTEVFADEGYSAKDMHRPQMQRLLKLIQNDQISSVITIAIDRLSRNLLDMLQFVSLCEKHHTAYVCAGLNFDTSTPIGRMVLQILAAFAEFERGMTSMRIHNTLSNIVQKRKRHLGPPPFGYRLDATKHLEVDPETAPIVKEMFRLFLEGYGFRHIAIWLNEQHIPTKRHRLWDRSSVRAVITNPCYTGTLIWNRTRQKPRDEDGVIRWEVKDESAWIEIEDNHPALISKEDYAKVIQRATTRLPRGGQVQSKHRLVGVVKCGYCGSPMVATRISRRVEQRGLICSKYHTKGACQRNPIHMDWLDEQIYSFLEQLASIQVEVPDTTITQVIKKQKEATQRTLILAEARFKRQLEAYEAGVLTLDQLKEAKKKLDEERAKSSMNTEPINVTRESVAHVYAANANHILALWTSGDIPVIQHAVRSTIESIIIKDKKIEAVNLAANCIPLTAV